MSTTSLTGKTALVTGGSRGIGRAIALRLAADGARVAVHYASNETAAKETVAAIEQAGGSAFAIRTELGVPGDAEALWKAFDAHADGVDILVNNAGIAGPGTIDEVEEADYDRVFAVNAKAPFFIVKHGLGRLRDGGRIINISSGVTKVAFPGMTSYASSKGAVEVLTLTLAQTLGSRASPSTRSPPARSRPTSTRGWPTPPPRRTPPASRSSTGSGSRVTWPMSSASSPPTTPAG